MPTISVADLRKTYREGMIWRKQFVALRGVSIDVEPGEIFGLLGQNGAGKTTFIKILLGIIRKTGGEASVLGFPAGNRAARQRIGYLPENLRVPRHLTGYTALEFYGALSNLSAGEVRHRRGPILENVGLVERAKDPVRTYSKGMLQRLGLAQAMLHEPEVFILDEPTDGLDPLARQSVRRTLMSLKAKGCTVFLNSHILQEVELICDRVAILDRGNLKFCGPVSKLTTDRSLVAGAANGAQVEIHWELTGSEAEVREGLAGCPFDQWQVIAPGRFRVVSRVMQPTDIDQLVDELRRRQVSIQAMSPRRTSLEDAYTEIVAEIAE